MSFSWAKRDKAEKKSEEEKQAMTVSIEKLPIDIILWEGELPWETSTIDDFPFSHSEIRGITVTDLRLIGPWKDVLSIVFKKLDFRILLTLMICCKDFKKLVETEIQRRELIISMKESFFSDQEIWFLGRKCKGTAFEEKYIKMISGEVEEGNRISTVMCKKYEEITTIGDHQMCRICYRIKSYAEGPSAHKLKRTYEKQEAMKEAEERYKKEQELRSEVRRNEGIRNTNLQRGIIGVEGEWKSQQGKSRTVFKTKNSSDL